MRFNLGVIIVLAAAVMWPIGPLIQESSGAATAGLWVCLAATLAIIVWRTLSLRQEPAVFAAVTYLSFGAVLAVGQALSGHLTETVAIVVTLPLLPALVTGDRRTRRWVNRIAGDDESDPQ